MSRESDGKVRPISSASSLSPEDLEEREAFAQAQEERLKRERAELPQPTEEEMRLKDLLREAEGLLYTGEAASREYLKETPEDLARALFDLKQALIEPQEWLLLMGIRRLNALLESYFPPQGPDGPRAARAKVP